MRKQIDHRECDHCGKVVKQSEMMFGGSPFNGWLSLERIDGSTLIPRADNGPWDFCGAACCVQFLTANKGSSLQWLEVLKKGIPMNGNWQPIETYDALKKKPRFAVFYVEATTAGRGYLSEMIVTERLFGYRTITHWVALPDLPSNKQHNS